METKDFYLYYGKYWLHERLPLKIERDRCDAKRCGERLFTRRKRKRLTQDGLAARASIEKVNISRSIIQKIERKRSKLEKNEINPKHMMLLSNALNCTFQYLVGKSDSPDKGEDGSYIFFIRKDWQHKTPEAAAYTLNNFLSLNIIGGIAEKDKKPTAKYIEIESFSPRKKIASLKEYNFEEILDFAKKNVNGIMVSSDNIRSYLCYIPFYELQYDNLFLDGNDIPAISEETISPSVEALLELLNTRNISEEECDEYLELHNVNTLENKRIYEKHLDNGDLEGILVIQYCGIKLCNDGMEAESPIRFFEEPVDENLNNIKKLCSIFDIEDDNFMHVNNKILLEYLYRLKDKHSFTENEIILNLHNIFSNDYAKWYELTLIYNLLEEMDVSQLKGVKKVVKALKDIKNQDMSSIIKSIKNA